MSEIKIEKNVPFPINTRKIYPIKEMQIGDSFLVPHKKASDVSYLVTDGKKFGYRLICRTVDGGARVWRIS